MSQGILVITEQTDGVFRKITYECVSEAKRLAGQSGAELTALVIGSGVGEIAAELGKYGADRILVADDPALAEFMTESYASVIANVVEKEGFGYIVAGSSTRGKDLAARLAAKLGAAVAMDCVEVRLEGENLVATRPMYGGKVLADISLEGTPRIAALRPNAMAITETAGAGKVENADVAAGETVLQFVEKSLSTDKAELTEADVVVSGGRGMGGSDFTIVEQLAEALNAAVGASRSAVDEGWRPHSDQVGQTGKTVSPNLYIACGISGAIQHLAGMSSSKVIAAINKDPEAPIFQKADYGIVGDLFEIVPHITEEIKKLKA